MSVRSWEVTVYGTPGPQGSKRHVGGGRMIESSKLVKPWREDVRNAALAACAASPDAFPMTGPLRAVIAFTLKKPASAPKRTRTWPSKKPDIDKLIRSTFDAIGSAGVWIDDAQVIDVRSMKSFPSEEPWSLAAPGAVIHVFTVQDFPDGPGRVNRAAFGRAAQDLAVTSDSREGPDFDASADNGTSRSGGAP